MNTFCFHVTNGDRTYTAKVQARTITEARTALASGLRDGERVRF